jgi:3'-5' exonuclease
MQVSATRVKWSVAIAVLLLAWCPGKRLQSLTQAYRYTLPRRSLKLQISSPLNLSSKNTLHRNIESPFPYQRQHQRPLATVAANRAIPRIYNRPTTLHAVHRTNPEHIMSFLVDPTILESLASSLSLVLSEDSERIPLEALQTAAMVLHSTRTKDTVASSTYTPSQLCELAAQVAHQLCQVDPNPTRKRKSGWQELQAFCQPLLSEPPETGNILAITLLFGALALSSDQGSKAAASALANTVVAEWSRYWDNDDKSRTAAHRDVVALLHTFFLRHAQLYKQTGWNWNIVTQFTRAFFIKDEAFLDSLIASIARQELERAQGYGEDWTQRKPIVAGIMGLVCQLRPWSSDLAPLELVQAAVPLDFWHAAEEVCLSHPSPDPAVEFLIDTSLDDHTYRRADQLATSLYQKGGRSRFVEARYQHACDTIAKIVYKRQLPIIERQVTRVDQSVEKVNQDPDGTNNGGRDFSKDIRLFVLSRLEAASEYDTAHRLATIWGMEYVYDEESMRAAEQARRETYLQYEEALLGSVPDLISDPQELRNTFKTFWKGGPYVHGPFGLDAEWEAGVKGVDLLQLSHPTEAILIDIPSLIATPQGITALKDTVGKLFDSPDTVVAGFACRQDLSRLRQGSWLGGTQAVVDIQPMVVQQEPTLAAISPRVGLARVCAFYFGKPLDKAEQCSFWAARPLSVRQRSYAALDAWVCAVVYKKLKGL